MSINTILGILSAIAFFLPVVIILYSRLFMNISLLVLVVYFTLTTTYNLMTENVLPVTDIFRRNWGIITNYLDVPLMLTAMFLFCINGVKKKLIIALIICFAIYEVCVIAVFKLEPISVTYIMGPGILVVAIMAFHFFVVNIKATIAQGKGLGKTLIAASITFAYGCYFLLYLFAYVEDTPNRADVYTIYYIASIIFSVTMSLGLLWLKKRFREISELQKTRKELHMFFSNR